MDLGLSAEPAPQATLAGPFLSAPPTLEQVSEHQAGILNSTMPMCDNTIPMSFLLWLRLGEERVQEDVATSIFPQCNPSLTSGESAVFSWCPCSFLSCSVTKQNRGGLFAKISPLRHRGACLPQRTPCLHCTSPCLLYAPRRSSGSLSLVSLHTTWFLQLTSFCRPNYPA